jgi:hypothetical protein
MVDANKNRIAGESFHLVVACDEVGIFDAFELVKNHLGNREKEILSMIYIVLKKNNRPLFEKELSILEKRFSSNFFIYLLEIDSVDYCYIQEFVEAIINSNTIPIMNFSVFGNENFIYHISEILRFLSIRTSQINSKII